ncbi:NADH-ubiquinone oxidoreductase [Teratosphaeria destructans]|uniref:NADH-ubiquinone oxidoreductase n=1 Tax=Teratosphaeria destructans TaxID=418781 RepID=A0A9W7SQ92_9PEZI|nr:NADH-ubiquinone oxidoreductase [Teratosphaeria destructans]
MAPVSFFEKPGQYISWAMRRKPAIFWSLVVGGMGPVVAVCSPRDRVLAMDGDADAASASTADGPARPENVWRWPETANPSDIPE